MIAWIANHQSQANPSRYYNSKEEIRHQVRKGPWYHIQDGVLGILSHNKDLFSSVSCEKIPDKSILSYVSWYIWKHRHKQVLKASVYPWLQFQLWVFPLTSGKKFSEIFVNVVFWSGEQISVWVLNDFIEIFMSVNKKVRYAWFSRRAGVTQVRLSL